MDRLTLIRTFSHTCQTYYTHVVNLEHNADGMSVVFQLRQMTKGILSFPLARSVPTDSIE